MCRGDWTRKVIFFLGKTLQENNSVLKLEMIDMENYFLRSNILISRRAIVGNGSLGRHFPSHEDMLQQFGGRNINFISCLSNSMDNTIISDENCFQTDGILIS